MDWSSIKSIICEGREFTVNDSGCDVLADTIMPTGGIIRVHFERRTDHLMAHDGGAAFDELARHGLEIGSLKGVRSMLSETRFNLSDEGIIWRDRFLPEQAAVAVSLVADASVRAATHMIAKSKAPVEPALDQRVREAMKLRFPLGHPNFTFEGQHRQHRFDYGVVQDGRTILLQSVNPEQTSVASAIVKGLDVKSKQSGNAVPIFVYDRRDGWRSDSLDMLTLGGRRVDIDNLPRGELPIAA